MSANLTNSESLKARLAKNNIHFDRIGQVDGLNCLYVYSEAVGASTPHVWAAEIGIKASSGETRLKAFSDVEKLPALALQSLVFCLSLNE
jgi:hypothetical protein